MNSEQCIVFLYSNPNFCSKKLSKKFNAAGITGTVLKNKYFLNYYR